MKVLVLHNPVAGTSAPDDLDTLTQVRAVEQGLRGLGHQVETLCFEAGEGMRHALEKAGPELVFNLVESVDGTSRRAHLAPALLEALGVPFTGAAAEPLRRSTNKLTAKAALTEAGVPTPAWRTLDGAGEDLPLSGPWLVKSVWEHASLGLEEDSVLRPQTLAELMDEMRSRRTDLGGECFAEAYIHGREFNLSLLQSSNGPEVLPPAELRFEGWAPDRARVVGYKAKWLEESPEYAPRSAASTSPGRTLPCSNASPGPPSTPGWPWSCPGTRASTSGSTPTDRPWSSMSTPIPASLRTQGSRPRLPRQA